MKFDVYGRFQLEVRWEIDHWSAYSLAPGKRVRVSSLVIPTDIQTAEEIARYLDDLYPEAATPGKKVSEIAD